MFQPRQIEKFHKEAANALATGEVSYNPRRRFRNFVAAFPEHRSDPRYLELLVMSGLFVQERHYFVLRVLIRLRRLRQAEGQEELFDAFDQAISNNKRGILLTNHGYSERTLADVDEGRFFEALKSTMKDVTDLGFQVAANSGTLLGLVRDKGLISFDDDVDLFVSLQADSHEQAAARLFELGSALERKGHSNALMKIELGVIKLNRVDGFDVDLLPAFEIDNKVFIYPYSFGELKRKHLFPLQECEATGLPIPADPETVLSVNYGKSWRIPDPRYIFPWDRQNAKFAPFLTALKVKSS